VRRLIGELKMLATGLKAASGTGGPQVTTLMAALERLTGHLTPLDPRGEPEAMAAQILARVRDGGLFFERKLAAAAGEEKAEAAPSAPLRAAESPAMAQTRPLLSDLKPHLQRLLIQLPLQMETLDPQQQLSEEGSRLLWTTVTSLLEEIDAGQKQLTEQRLGDTHAVMRHSMWIEGSEKPLRFNVYLPRKDGGRKGGGRKGGPAANPMVSLLLDLKRLGTLRVDVREQKNREKRCLGVDVWTQTKAVGEELQVTSAPLIDILRALYPQVDYKIEMDPDRVAAFDQADHAPHGGKGHGDRSRLDIRV
jgi:hypothetical protein